MANMRPSWPLPSTPMVAPGRIVDLFNRPFKARRENRKGAPVSTRRPSRLDHPIEARIRHRDIRQYDRPVARCGTDALQIYPAATVHGGAMLQRVGPVRNGVELQPR